MFSFIRWQSGERGRPCSPSLPMSRAGGGFFLTIQRASNRSWGLLRESCDSSICSGTPRLGPRAPIQGGERLRLPSRGLMCVSGRVTGTSRADPRLPRQLPLQRSPQPPFQPGVTLTARNEIGHDRVHRGAVLESLNQETGGSQAQERPLETSIVCSVG